MMKQDFAQKGTSYRVFFIVIVILCAAVLVLNWNRLYYGVEVTDEAFYVAEGYIVANGAIPFTDAFAPVSGCAFLYSWIIKIYTVISGGTEGIFLFMRQAFFVYKAVVAGVLILLLRRSFSSMPSLLFPLLYLTRSFAIENFSYNTLSFSFLLLTCVLLFSALQEKEKYSRQYSFLSGILMALTILAHPMQLTTAGYIFILLLFFERRFHKTFFRSGLYAIGGILTGFAVTVYLIIRSGGVSPLLSGISRSISSTENIPENIAMRAYNIGVLVATLTIFIRNILVPGLVCFLGLLLMAYLIRKRKGFQFQIDIKTIYILTLFLTQLANILICAYIYSRNLPIKYNYILADIIYCQVYVMILLLLVNKLKKHIMFICFVFSPFLFFYLTYVFTPSGLSAREYALYPGVMISVIFMYYALDNISIPPIAAAHKSAITNSCVIILTVAFLAVCMSFHYAYVYRDFSIPSLTYKMEKGVYKGLHTTQKRGEALLYLEDEIKKVTNKDDTVLFMDQVSQAYLMTEALHCTPSTWDLLQYIEVYLANQSGEFADDSLLYDYFKAVGREPSKIIYIQNRVYFENLSLYDEKFPFNRYVERYYKEIYANGAEQFGIIVFERTPA